MSVTTHTVHDRVEYAFDDVSPTQLAALILFASALGAAMVFAQDPVLHETMHHFRHGTGITCH